MSSNQWTPGASFYTNKTNTVNSPQTLKKTQRSLKLGHSFGTLKASYYLYTVGLKITIFTKGQETITIVKTNQW